MTDGRTTPAQCLFIFEPHPALMQRCTMVAESAGYRVVSATRAREAAAALDECAPAALLIAFSPAGVELGQALRELTARRAPLLVMLERDEDRARALSMTGADGFLLRPFSSSTLQAVLSVAGRLPLLEEKIIELRREVAETTPPMRHLASAINSRTGFYQFEFIKDLLLVEVRRAKRYGYPLAILLVGLDPIADRPELNSPALQRDITGGLAVAIAKSTRDIDIPIHYADDRILVFLPHTDLRGAEEVGRRIKRRIKRITYRGEQITAQLTASVGVAGISAGENLTFSRLIKDAAAALRAAQLKGGDRVMKRVLASKTADDI